MVQPKGEVENLQLRLLDCYHIGRARKACRILLHGEEQKLRPWQHRRKVLPKDRSRSTSPSQDSEQTVERYKVRESRRLQTDLGLRRKTSSDDCAGKVGECALWEDSPLLGREPVVLLAETPTQRLSVGLGFWEQR
jgi:hypothetical protein